MINSVFKDVSDILALFEKEDLCLQHLEDLRWDGKVISPFDTYSKVYKCKLNRYRCKNTGKYFNAKTGTIFHNSKIEMPIWFAAIWLVANNSKITSTLLAKELGLTQKTAWFMRRKIKQYLKKGDLATDLFKNTDLNIRKVRHEKQEKRNVSEWLQILKK